MLSILLRQGLKGGRKTARRANQFLLLDHGWSCKGVAPAPDMDSGAVDPEQLIEAPTVDAWRRIALSTAIAIMDPFKWRTQAFLENARRHHADRATEWLVREGMPDRTAREQSASNVLDARRVAERLSRLTVPPDRAIKGGDA